MMNRFSLVLAVILGASTQLTLANDEEDGFENTALTLSLGSYGSQGDPAPIVDSGPTQGQGLPHHLSIQREGGPSVREGGGPVPLTRTTRYRDLTTSPGWSYRTH